jgi:hypothetical protein
MMRGRPGPAGVRLFHHLQALFSLAGAQQEARIGGGRGRRRRQQRAVARRLLHPLPPGLLPTERGGDRFWTALRWGGVGLLLAGWLAR